MANRQMSEIESTGRQNRFAANQKIQMEKKAFETADDNEYYRKKAAWDVKAGNMNPDTYDMLYSGAAASGGFPAAKGGLRGKGQGQEPDYMDVLSKAYAAKPEDDARTFSQYAAEEMQGLRTTFPQQGQQTMNAEDMYKAQKLLQPQSFKVTRGGKDFDVDTSGPRAKWTRQGGYQDPLMQAGNASSKMGGAEGTSIYQPPPMRANIATTMAKTIQPSASVATPATSPVRSKIGLSNKGTMTTIPTASDDESEQRRNKRLRGGYINSPFGGRY